MIPLIAEAALILVDHVTKRKNQSVYYTVVLGIWAIRAAAAQGIVFGKGKVFFYLAHVFILGKYHDIL